MALQFVGKKFSKVRRGRKKAEKEVPIAGDGRYVVGACVGRGYFGHVYEGTELLRPRYKVAIKVQDVHRDSHCTTAIAECQVMTRLKGGIGIPKLLWSGMECGSHLIIMELLGPSLSDLWPLAEESANNMGFSMKTVARISLQMISRLEFVHGHGIVHRDVKPDNMLMGRDANCNTLFLTDYGLSRSWKDLDTGYHLYAKPVLPKKKTSITGTVRYCSVNVHQGQVYSRRDDMISLCYSLIYLRTACLPWVGIKADTMTAKMDKVLERKLSCTPGVLCVNLPLDFMRFVSACFNMGFYEQPNYSRLRSMINSIARANSFHINIGPWDWQLAGATSRMAEEASGNPKVGIKANKTRMNMLWMHEVLVQGHHKARVQQQETRARRRIDMDVPVLPELPAPLGPGSRKQEKPRNDLITPVTGGLLKIGYQKLVPTERHCTPPASSLVLPKISDDKARAGCLPLVGSLLCGRPPVQEGTTATQLGKYDSLV